MWQLQVMRVESTDGQRQEVGLYLSDSMAARVLRNIRDLQPLKPSQFAGGKLLKLKSALAWLLMHKHMLSP